MVVDERLVTYINSLDKGNTEILDIIEREALDTYVPIIRKEMQSFLKLICNANHVFSKWNSGWFFSFDGRIYPRNVKLLIEIMIKEFQLRENLSEQEKNRRLHFRR